MAASLDGWRAAHWAVLLVAWKAVWSGSPTAEMMAAQWADPMEETRAAKKASRTAVWRAGPWGLSAGRRAGSLESKAVGSAGPRAVRRARMTAVRKAGLWGSWALKMAGYWAE